MAEQTDTSSPSGAKRTDPEPGAVFSEMVRLPSTKKTSPIGGPIGLDRGRFDIGAYLERIERASLLLNKRSEQARQLEDQVRALDQELKQSRDHETQLLAEVQEWHQHAGRLETHLSSERERASRAETLAASLTEQLARKGEALAEAEKRLAALTNAIEHAFEESATRGNAEI